MKKLTKEQTVQIINTIKNASEPLKGTENYYKYWMETEMQVTKTNHFTGESYTYWHFVGNYYPTYVINDDTVMIYKVIKGQDWIYYGDTRYRLTDEVKKLLSNIF